MANVSSLLLLVLAVTAVAADFNFVSIGDWGCVPIGGWRAQDELTIAKQFGKAATALNARFVLNTGDNFYYCGVHNKSDEMWQTTYENVFTEPSMSVPWYSCLGNHDYGYPGSAEAQMEYVSPNNNRWVLPDRYYYRRLSFPGEVDISLVVLDASPCQSEYTSSDPAGWDPCGSVIPACPGCTFHQNVIKQNCSKQLAWLEALIPTLPADDWKIAMVHAPAPSLDVEDFVSPLQGAGFDMYINGHVHLLAEYTMDNIGTYITTGAGCLVRITNDDGTDTNTNDTKGDGYVMPPVGWVPSTCTGHNTAHTCQVVFQDVVAGYTTHSFSSDFSTLTTTFYNSEGTKLHETTTTKGQQQKKNARSPQ